MMNNENELPVALVGVDELLNAAQRRIDKATIKKKDLLLVSQWAKLDLFKKVKFLYNQEKDFGGGQDVVQAVC